MPLTSWTKAVPDPHTREAGVSAPRWHVGRFARSAASHLWTTENQIGQHPLIVFPDVPVRIEQAGRAPVIATRATAVFYDPHTVYRRRLLDPRGDRCHYVALEPTLWDEVRREVDPRWEADGFRAPGGPVHPALRLAFERLLLLVAAPTVDELAADEAVLAVAGAALRASADAEPPPGALARRHREAAAALEAHIASRFRVNDSLHDLAQAVGLSAFHAARLFRRHTGLTMHAYRERLRLAESLRAIAAGERLDEVGLGVGFASHAHFTDRFRRAFGFPPSAARASTITKAPGRCRP
jgi:AraC-like DNA-binding protein